MIMIVKKRKKPDFFEQDYFRYKRLGKRWRRPKGRQSKLRKGKGGSGVKPSIGYRWQKETRGFVKVGQEFVRPVMVSNEKSLGELDKKSVVLISSGVGAKKTAAIAKRAKELGIRILNMKKVKRSEKIEKTIKEKKKLTEKNKN